MPSVVKPATIPFGTWLASQAVLHLPKLLLAAGEWETQQFGHEWRDLSVDRPIFVCGLARSGTTITLELLNAVAGVGSHRYRDFPIVHAPVLWSRFLDRAGADAVQPVERFHQDGIMITRESPEAIDEPIWNAFFPSLHAGNGGGPIDLGSESGRRFSSFYKEHMRKILFLRQARRLVTKGNYLISRLPLLQRLFPDLKIILLVREPVEHVASLARQHELFSDAQRRDRRLRTYLKALGHFEFGLDRHPIDMGDAAALDRINAAWSQGDEWGGLALYWDNIYAMSRLAISSDEALSSRVLVMRFEDLYNDPRKSVRKLLEHCELEVGVEEEAKLVERLRAPSPRRDRIAAAVVERVQDICSGTAAAFGY